MNKLSLTIFICCCVALYQGKPAVPKVRSLVDVIKQIDATKFFAILTTEEQNEIIGLVIAGEGHTMAQYIQRVGYASVLQIIEKLPENYAKEITGYVVNALTNEAIPSSNGVGQASTSVN